MLVSGNHVKVDVEGLVVDGTVIHNYTGNEKKLVVIEFTYNSQVYQWPFSRKTGKPYRVKFFKAIKLLI